MFLADNTKEQAYYWTNKFTFGMERDQIFFFISIFSCFFVSKCKRFISVKTKKINQAYYTLN